MNAHVKYAKRRTTLRLFYYVIIVIDSFINPVLNSCRTLLFTFIVISVARALRSGALLMIPRTYHS